VKWHPLLQEYESKRPGTVSIAEHEHQWERYEELRKVISDARAPLVEYANILAEVAGVPSLLKNNAQEALSLPLLENDAQEALSPLGTDEHGKA
jgi:hypothetical protein